MYKEAIEQLSKEDFIQIYNEKRILTKEDNECMRKIQEVFSL